MTGSQGQERLTRLCSATGEPFPFINERKQIDKVGKKYVQVIPAVWKAEKILKEVTSVNNISEVLERKLWAGEKLTIPAGRERPLNPDQRANLKDQLDEWIQQGIIEPANSPWASPLVPVKKKDGRTRWVTDLRLLNDVTVKDAYPLTNIQENLQKLKGAKIYSSIDACGAYHCIQIEENSPDCTAFISPFGTFRCIQMPFSLSNAGSVYSQMLDLALAHLPVVYWLSYLDILVYSMDT